MNSAELEIVLRQHGGKFVYNNILLNEDVYILSEQHKQAAKDVYHDFKVAVSNALDVPVKNVAIVGSAKTGYSLTPGRNYSPFGAESDLDLVIVSDRLFIELWESYLNFVNSFTGQAYSHIAKNVFKHFISIKSRDVTGEQLKYFSNWVNKVDHLKLQLELKFKLPLEVNYRVYDDWKYVEQYHVTGLNALIGS
jgi:hypothetical protein